MDKISFFILNIFVNSLLAFFTVAFLIEGLIFLFRIRQGRLAATLRLIPIFKLPLDLFLYDFSNWSYAQGINPLDCAEGTRTLSMMFGLMYEVTDGLIFPIRSGIQLSVLENMTFTLSDMIGYLIHPILLNTLILWFILLSIVSVSKRVIYYYDSIKALNLLKKNAQSISRKIGNVTLLSSIKNSRVRIMTLSHLHGSPFVAGFISCVIYIPSQISQKFSRKEYEAVLTHEIAHIKYRDNLVRFILDCVESFFWWVPTRWLHNRIEEGQEVGCDLECEKYGIQPLVLASAICKSIRHAVKTPHSILTHHFTQHTAHKRIHTLLTPPSMHLKKIRFVLSIPAIGIALMIFLGKFWIF